MSGDEYRAPGDLLPLVVGAIMRPTRENAAQVVRAMEQAPDEEYRSVKNALFTSFPEKADLMVTFFAGIELLRGGHPIKQSRTISES